jgi:hypothetical protein
VWNDNQPCDHREETVKVFCLMTVTTFPHYFLACSTLQMLTNIENRLEELFEQIEMMPPEKVEMAEKVLCGSM